VGAALLLVLGGAALLGMTFPAAAAPEACPIETSEPAWSSLVRGFGASLRESAVRSLPAILLGVFASAAIVGLLPPKLASGAFGGASAYVAIVVAALVAVPIALPTFGEIPLALALIAAGAPTGMIVALLIAGPAINLPSLLTLARTTSPRVALAMGATVFGFAAVSGCALQAVAG
jgi:uncharacterized membrane protein YraQ (UPF0718 family)